MMSVSKLGISFPSLLLALSPKAEFEMEFAFYVALFPRYVEAE